MKGSKVEAALVLRERGPDLNLQPPSPEVGAVLFTLISGRPSLAQRGCAILDCCGEVTSFGRAFSDQAKLSNPQSSRDGFNALSQTAFRPLRAGQSLLL